MRFEKRTFDGETVTLDGNNFIECTILDSCEVNFYGGNFTLANTTIGAAVRFGFGGAARVTLDLLKILQGQRGPKYINDMLTAGPQPQMRPSRPVTIN
jgi:hypothetical protein